MSNIVLNYLNAELVANPITKRVKALNDKIGLPMRSDCIAAVVIPAHNEALNIGKLIQSIRDQEINIYGLNSNSFETIIVDNNSTDGTRDRAQELIQQYELHDRVHVVSVIFDEKEKCAAAARKLGIDLALYRAFVLREERDQNNDFFIMGLDADENIQQDHYEKSVQSIMRSQVDVMFGKFEHDASCFPKDSLNHRIVNALNEYRAFPYTLKPIGIQFLGANHIMKASLYAKSGGYPSDAKVYDDCQFGMIAESHGASFEWLDITFMANPRRLISDPMSIFSKGSFKSLIQYLEVNANMREGNGSNSDYSLEQLQRAFAVFVDSTAHEIAHSRSTRVDISINQEKKRFAHIALKHELPTTVLPDDIFWMHRLYNFRSMRALMGNDKKREFLLKELEAFATEFIAVNLVLVGPLAAWIYGNHSQDLLPNYISIAVFENRLDELLQKFREQGYEFFEYVQLDRQVFYVKFKGNYKDLINGDNWFLVKVNSDGVPVMEQSPLFNVFTPPLLSHIQVSVLENEDVDLASTIDSGFNFPLVNLTYLFQSLGARKHHKKLVETLHARLQSQRQ